MCCVLAFVRLWQKEVRPHFGLIRRRRRRRRRFVCRLKKKSNQKRDRSNVKCQRQKRKKGREKPIYPLELLPPQSDFQGKKIFEEKF